MVPDLPDPTPAPDPSPAPDPQAKRPRGRPKDDAKRTALLDAARLLFLARGIEVGMDEVAAKAGVAKATLYANFSDKSTLIEAVIRREADITITDDQFARATEVPIAEALAAFGTRYVNFINNRDLLGWDRLIASLEAQEDELPKRFFEAGPGRGQRILAALIEHAIARGQLRQASSAEAADALTGLWLGFVTLEIKLGVRPPLTEVEIRQRVARGVDIFLTVYGPPGGK